MSDALPATRAPRLRAPTWRDPRLVVGVLLVLLSVVVGGRVLATSDRTVPVWATATTLAAGDAVSQDALTVVDVRLEGAVADYLPATGAPPAGVVALRTLAPGELVPASAVGPASDLRLKPVGVPYDGVLPSGLLKGAQVDVWVTPVSGVGALSGEAPVVAEPEQLAAAAEVAEVSAPTGAFTGSGGATVQVLLDEDGVAAALAARASGAEVSLVLVPGTTPADR